MRVLSGIAISPGLGRGKAWFLTDTLLEPFVDETPDRINRGSEKQRLETALAAVKVELELAATQISEQLTEEFAEIFRVHGMMLDRFLLSGEFGSEVEAGDITAEAAVRRIFQRWEAKFLRIADPVSRSKADDLADLFRKILRALRHDEAAARAADMPYGSILFTRRLLPSDVVSLSRGNVEAIVVEQLAKGSHSALLARERGIPTLAGIPNLFTEFRPQDEVLVDASRGQLAAEPDAATSDSFYTRLEQYKRSIEFCRVLCHQPATTHGGAVIKVMANIGSHETAEAATMNGADGVGLFRLEQLYLSRQRPPDSDELFDELLSILQPLQEKPVTIRLLDIGGDKIPQFLKSAEDNNPLLGRRGVRLLLAYPELIRRQLKALLRLSAEMPIRILVPMVTLTSDMKAMRILFEDVVSAESGSSPPPLGAMIETPAAALDLEELCPLCDFFSIGSNDLTQYTLAAARENPDVNDYYQEAHPAVLRLLRMIVESAGEKPVTLCGELAGREDVIPQLVSMGLRALSVAPIQIPAVKQQIRTLSHS